MNKNTSTKKDQQELFTCISCGEKVITLEYGGQHRNHCPHCLCSSHLDITPGDRRSQCHGIMKPAGIHVQKNGEWSIIHKCSKCGSIKINRIAYDDNELLLLTLAAEPLMSLPFPSKKIISTLQALSQKKQA